MGCEDGGLDRRQVFRRGNDGRPRCDTRALEAGEQVEVVVQPTPLRAVEGNLDLGEQLLERFGVGRAFAAPRFHHGLKRGNLRRTRPRIGSSRAVLDPKSLDPTINRFFEVEMNQNDVAHAFDRSPVDIKQSRHFVESQTFDALRERVHKLQCAVEITEALGHHGPLLTP
jgi:hypothetical protein